MMMVKKTTMRTLGAMFVGGLVIATSTPEASARSVVYGGCVGRVTTLGTWRSANWCGTRRVIRRGHCPPVVTTCCGTAGTPAAARPPAACTCAACGRAGPTR